MAMMTKKGGRKAALSDCDKSWLVFFLTVNGDRLIAPDRFKVEQDQQINNRHDPGND